MPILIRIIKQLRNMFEPTKPISNGQQALELHRLRIEHEKLFAIYNTIFQKPEPFVLVYIFDVLVNAFRYEKDCSGEKILDGYPRMAALADMVRNHFMLLGIQRK